jgi:putative membrane-bound dehydrogenase-like protein
MIPSWTWLTAALVGAGLALVSPSASAQTALASRSPGNRLTYLDEDDPFYAHRDFPKLTTPQWVGEPGVEAVVILAIDDMRETPRYETVLRPILERLKHIDGRAPVSIFCNRLDPADAQLQSWLKEGVSLEVHTLTHPCPLLARNDFTAAATNFHDCVDLLNQVSGNRPVAFRMPCCDSINSPSPRFYAEIFNRASRGGKFLSIDSSVMNIITPRDQTLPRELVLDPDGREKFRKYLPAATNQVTKVTMGSFVTTIEDYPYPYVIGKLCWEFPCGLPSDWEAQNLHTNNNPRTVADWKAALDVTVLKQGTLTFIFHPHGWIKPEQMVEFINYAAQKYGRKVKFLNFREAQDRLDNNLLAGQPLRRPDGQDNGVRLIDLNNDGYLDVVISNARMRKTRLWDPQQKTWSETPFPAELPGVQFGVMRANGSATALQVGETAGAWHFDDHAWVEDKSVLAGFELEGKPVVTIRNGRDRGVRFRDVDNDGRCELIVGNETQNAVFTWSPEEKSWQKLDYALPPGTSIVDAEGNDNGLRFVDLNEDGYDDVIFSNAESYSLHIYRPKRESILFLPWGWADEVISAKRGAANLIPMIVRGGTSRNNGAWFHSRQMWVQNEDTATLPDVVDRRAFKPLLAADQPAPKSPEESLAAIQARPGFKVELVASEPLVMDPIAFEWGADGKLWVVEMADYPRGLDGQGKPGGRVRFLEDVDGDGRYDKSTVFLDGLNFPTGVVPWRKGVIVSAAPEIFYAEDTDGDGKADRRETLFTGFHEGNQQHRVNGFEYGLDNWLYGANGDSGGEVRAGRAPRSAVALDKSPKFPVRLSGHDFRFRPDEGWFEAVAGQTQYGRHRDDWGNWFGNNNPTWLWHFYLPENYLARNPYLAVKTTKRMLANYPDSGRAFPSSRLQARFNDPAAANRVTSGNSPTPYRDELFGPDFRTSVFVSEPVHNLVHREVLEADGATFTSHRARGESESEFLRSSDNWFRPTMLKTGPDGALYIADMYRLVIEHPEWIPISMQKRLDLRAGSDKGRIYRVYPEGATLRKIPRLDQLDVRGLVAALDSPNGWQRDTAQRLLVHRADKSAVPLLAKLMAASAHPKTRLQALCALDGLDAVVPKVVSMALKDAHPAIREHGVRVGEKLAAESFRKLGPGAVEAAPPLRGVKPPEVREMLETLLRLVGDPDLRVRYQLAFSVGEWHHPVAARVLARLALADAENPELQTAILSSAPEYVAEMIPSILISRANGEPPAKLLEELFGLTAAQGRDNASAGALAHVAKSVDGRFRPWQFRAMAGFLDGLGRNNVSWEQFQTGGGSALKALAFDGLFAAARNDAMDTPAPEAVRLAAIRLLGRRAGEETADLDRLAELLRPQVPSALQGAALAGLKRSRGSHAAEVALAGWRGYGPSLRTEIINLILSRAEWLPSLLTALESGSIPPGEIGPAHQQKLIAHAEPSIRERAVKLFSATRADRHELLKEYEAVARLAGDPAKGIALYRQNCAACHRLKGEGTEIGPDLAGLADKPAATLLVAILDPNQAVEARYINYNAVTRSGRELSGIISAETPNSITLRGVGGAEEVILRNELAELKSSGLSLMPEGFEKAFQPQDLADLIAAIRAR